MNYIKPNPVECDRKCFMDSIDLAKLLEDQLQCWNSDTSINELEISLLQMKLGKSPGIDGLTTEFYRTFKEMLLPYLQGLFNYCRSKGVSTFLQGSKIGLGAQGG